ncbi:MAG: glycosyltransferase family 4 protein [Anaerolineae bacterium]
MRIAVPLARTSISGGTRIALQYAEELAKLGHQVTLVFPSDTRFDYFSLPANVQKKSVTVPPTARSLFKGLADIFAIGKAIPPSDVILCNCWQMVFPALVSIALARGPRIVHLVQHLDSIIIAEKSWFYRWRNKLLYRFIYKLPITTKIVVSRWLKDALFLDYGQVSICVPNGINLRNFTGDHLPQWEPPSDTFDILCTGRLAKWKGYQDVIDAVGMLTVSNPQVRLIVASREDVSIPVNITGVVIKPTNDLELGHLYQQCSVFVMASWCEGFGLPALEAMACGAPVVTTACCGIDDFARDGENCLITPPREPTKLAEAIHTIMMDHALALRLSKAGIDTGREFTTERMARQLVEVMMAEEKHVTGPEKC